MAIGCNAQENMFKLSYLMLQKKFSCWKLRGARAPVPHSWRRHCEVLELCVTVIFMVRISPSRTRSVGAPQLLKVENFQVRLKNNIALDCVRLRETSRCICL
jgi:hypothetical protein